mgnify:FL=1
MTAPRRGAGEHVAEVVLACVLFVLASICELLFILGIVFSWWLSPAAGGLVSLVVFSGLVFPFLLQSAQSVWREARGVTCRPGRLPCAGRAVLVNTPSSEAKGGSL